MFRKRITYLELKNAIDRGIGLYSEEKEEAKNNKDVDTVNRCEGAIEALEWLQHDFALHLMIFK